MTDIKPAPLTTTEKQRRRMAELDAIAQAAGWLNWTRYATDVKNGVVSIETNPAAARANGRRGGRPKKSQGDLAMHTITVRYPGKQNKAGEFINWKRMEKKFSNQENAVAWARECEKDIEQDKGNLWPTDVLVDGVSVESSRNIYTRF